MPRFLTIYRSAETGEPPTPEMIETMNAYIEQKAAEGVLISTEGCQSSAQGAKLRLSNGDYAVTDGPFAEAKEIVGGFAILQCNSKEQAIEECKSFMQVAGDGETEIRELYEAPALA